MIVIDRFEGDIAVLEADGEMLEISKHDLPESAAEGDILQNDGGVWSVDTAATEERRVQMRDRLRRLTK